MEIFAQSPVCTIIGHRVGVVLYNGAALELAIRKL
jgi:hypothetical protein